MTTELLEFARAEFEMAEIQDDGLPLRDHLEKSAYSPIMPNREAAARLAAIPDMPTEGPAVALWADFMLMHSRRSWSESGPLRLDFGAIQNFQTVQSIQLEKWEIDAILLLDDEFFAVRAEAKK